VVFLSCMISTVILTSADVMLCRRPSSSEIFPGVTNEEMNGASSRALCGEILE